MFPARSDGDGDDLCRAAEWSTIPIGHTDLLWRMVGGVLPDTEAISPLSWASRAPGDLLLSSDSVINVAGGRSSMDRAVSGIRRAALWPGDVLAG